MKVYGVLEVVDTEYGNTEVVRVYATYASAQAYVQRHQYTWEAWWTDKEMDALTIEEWEVED